MIGFSFFVMQFKKDILIQIFTKFMPDGGKNGFPRGPPGKHK